MAQLPHLANEENEEESRSLTTFHPNLLALKNMLTREAVDLSVVPNCLSSEDDQLKYCSHDVN